MDAAGVDAIHVSSGSYFPHPRNPPGTSRCLVNAVENPLGCYDQSRFDSRAEMLAQIMSVFTPAPFV